MALHNLTSKTLAESIKDLSGNAGQEGADGRAGLALVLLLAATARSSDVANCDFKEGHYLVTTSGAPASIAADHPQSSIDAPRTMKKFCHAIVHAFDPGPEGVTRYGSVPEPHTLMFSAPEKRIAPDGTWNTIWFTVESFTNWFLKRDRAAIEVSGSQFVDTDEELEDPR